MKCPGLCEWNPCGCCENNIVNFCKNCHSNGCSQCEGGNAIFKRNYQYFCENCTDIFGPACMFCQDFNGCGQCKQGYQRVMDPISGMYYCKNPYNPAPVSNCGPTGEVGQNWPNGEDPSCIDPPPTPKPTPKFRPPQRPEPTPYPTRMFA